jgi:hypothetical protein
MRQGNTQIRPNAVDSNCRTWLQRKSETQGPAAICGPWALRKCVLAPKSLDVGVRLLCLTLVSDPRV